MFYLSMVQTENFTFQWVIFFFTCLIIVLFLYCHLLHYVMQLQLLVLFHSELLFEYRIIFTIQISEYPLEMKPTQNVFRFRICDLHKNTGQIKKKKLH